MTITERQVAGGTWNKISREVYSRLRYAQNHADYQRPPHAMTIKERMEYGGTKNRMKRRVASALRCTIWHGRHASAGSAYQKEKWARAKKVRSVHHRAHVDAYINYRRHVKSRYGITRDEYDRILASQNGHCAICDVTSVGNRHHRTLCIDHDHNTKVVRGLLCHDCNTGLGFLKTAERLEAALAYLKKGEGK